MFSILNKIFSMNNQRENNLEIGLNWHEDFILSLAKILRPNVYVELGLYQCKLFNSIEPFANNLYGVDIMPDIGSKYMIKSKKAKFFHGKTEEFLSEVQSSQLNIDLLFIDADHSKGAVKADFENFFPYVKDDGIILLHDAYPENEEFTASGYCGDGYKAIEELAKNIDTYEMMTIPIPPGLSICRKRKKQVKWE